MTPSIPACLRSAPFLLSYLPSLHLPRFLLFVSSSTPTVSTNYHSPLLQSSLVSYCLLSTTFNLLVLAFGLLFIGVAATHACPVESPRILKRRTFKFLRLGLFGVPSNTMAADSWLSALSRRQADNKDAGEAKPQWGSGNEKRKKRTFRKRGGDEDS